jgi:hypothetical protein
MFPCARFLPLNHDFPCLSRVSKHKADSCSTNWTPPHFAELPDSRSDERLDKHKNIILTFFLFIGIIYSDIGTSPLYVLNGIWPVSGPVPSKEDIIGGVSAIVWSLTLLPLLKYVNLRFPDCVNFVKFAFVRCGYPSILELPKVCRS